VVGRVAQRVSASRFGRIKWRSTARKVGRIMSQKVAVSCERDNKIVTIKLQADCFEFNVRIAEDQIAQLKNVPNIDWENGALKLGKSADADVFWCADGDDFISVMIGHDDQTWDIAFQLPTGVIDDIFRSISIA
jgi:hypothetical protein